MPEIVDDKTPKVLPFILTHLQHHLQSHPSIPFFIGLNGVQGAGKTVLVSSLRSTLSSPPHNLSTVVFSLDDLYLTHADQVHLAQTNPSNPLLQHRGQPSTHDVPLALSVFESLAQNKPTRIPQYNKAAFSGKGDRVSDHQWPEVNTDSEHPIKIVIFEGWCVGFRALTPAQLEQRYSTAANAVNSPDATYRGRLGHNTVQSVTTINDALHQYQKLWSYFSIFIHIDASDPLYVYKWRLEQEETTRREKGGGMTDEEVRNFVDGYYPAYELYTETLRQGVFRPIEGGEEEREEGWKGRQMRLIVDENRRVKEVVVL